MRALILPLDNRPVTCVFPQMIARMAGVEPLSPPRELLGSLNQPAKPEALASWMDAVLAANRLDGLILCLDSLLYGGLISSRRCPDSAGEILKRVSTFSRWRKSAGSQAAILAQSSIMRISDNYDPTEEKPYWARHGREIFEWSACLHRLARGEKLAPGQLSSLEAKIPQAVRDDYLATRRRNFGVNRRLLTEGQAGNLDFLVFSADDSGARGLNVLEREMLVADAERLGLSKKVIAYPGADEVVMTLLSRLVATLAGMPPRVAIVFSPPETANCPGRYEGQSTQATAAAQLAAAGLEVVPDGGDADFVVVVHGRPSTQGDHIHLPGQPNLQAVDTAFSVARTITTLESLDKPFVLCDVAYANGADPMLVEELLARKDILVRLWGYAGWNTSGNTMGSAVAMGTARWHATRQAPSSMPAPRTNHKNAGQPRAPTGSLPLGSYPSAKDAGAPTSPGLASPGSSKEYLSRCLFIRFLDDWAYQALVRKTLAAPVDSRCLGDLLAPYAEKISQALDFQPKSLALTFPWRRTFEIEVAL